MWMLLLSALAGMIYTAIGIARKKITTNSLVDVVRVIFSTISVVGGSKLVVVTFITNQFFKEVTNIDLVAFTMLGGFIVIWLAAWELCEKIKDLYKIPH